MARVVIEGLEDSVTYEFWVSAKDNAGNETIDGMPSAGSIDFRRTIDNDQINTVFDLVEGTYDGTLDGKLEFGAGGGLIMTDNTTAFSVTPVDGIEMIARGIKLYADADNYMLMEKTGAATINVEIMGGKFRTGSATSYLELDSTGLKSYNSSTQRVQILNDGSGWLGASDAVYWDSSGNVTISGTVTVTNIEATTGTIAGWDINTNDITKTFDTDKTLVLSTVTNNESIYFYDPTPTTDDVRWLGMGTLHNGTGWTTETGIGMVVYNGSTYDRIFWLSDVSSTISGFDLDANYLKKGNAYFGNDLGTDPGATASTLLAGNWGDGTIPIVRIYGGTVNDYVSLWWTDSNNWGLKGIVSSNDYFHLGSVNHIGGWTFTQDLLQKVFDTDKQINLRVTADSESIYFYDPTPGAGDVTWVGIGTLYDQGGVGWTGETGIGMTVWDGASAYDKYFWLSDVSASIAGWGFTKELLRSAASAERIELNSTENRISIFDAVNEKVIMGYLSGVTRNNCSGNATGGSSTYLDDTGKDFEIDSLIGLTISITGGTGSPQSRTITDNTATRITASFSPAVDDTSDYEVLYTSSNYGFWALDGDELMIDGDITYESGDWIVHNDASLKILDGNGNEIIRLGTDTGEKGLFIYNTSSVQLAKYISDEIYIGTTGNYLQYTVAGGLVIEGDVTINSYPSQPFDEDALLLWPLDSLPLDQSGNDNDNNSSNGANVTYVDGGVGGGYAALFPNGTAAADHLLGTIDYESGTRTFTFWAKSSSATINQVFDHSAGNAGALFFNYDGTRIVLSLGASNYRYWDDAPEQDDGEWHFWVLYIPGSAQADIDNTELYVDNDLQTVYSTVSSSGQSTWSYLRCGYDYDGYLQDFRVYNRQLTANERVAIMTNPMNRGTTRITGDKIRTGTIQSNNWDADYGSQFNLDDGTFYMGGSSAPKLSWNGTTLAISGSVTITTGSGLGNLTDSGDLAAMAATPSGDALFLNSTYIGFYSSGVATNFIKSDGSGQFASGDITWTANGDFALGDLTSASYILWDAGDDRLLMGRNVEIEFASGWVPGGNLMGPDLQKWHETSTPDTDNDTGYFVTSTNPFGGDDNNAIIIHPTPHGEEGLVWECTPTVGDVSDGGWAVGTFQIDKTKSYRYSVWVKRHGTDAGSFYFGPYDSATHSSNLSASGADSGNSNPYFFSGIDVKNAILGDYNVTNGNMEGTGDWTVVNSATSSRNGTYYKAGTYSREVVVTAALSGIKSNNIALQKGQEYIFTFWLYQTASKDWQAFITNGDPYIVWADDGTDITLTPTTYTWVQYKKSFVCTDTGYYFVQFRSAPGNTDGTVYIDEVKVATNLIADDDAELDSAHWLIHNTPSVNERSSTQAHAGTYSRKITVDAADEGVYQKDIRLIEGKQYKLKFWLYGDTNDWQVGIYDTDNGLWYYARDPANSYITTLAPTATWTEYELDFVATATTDDARIVFKSATGNSTGTLYIDDVVFTEDPWYLAVGYLHPSGSKVTTSMSGLYRYMTGEKVLSGTDFKHMSTATTQRYRSFFYSCETTTNRMYMWNPSIYIVDGSEPSLSDMLSNAVQMGQNLESTTYIDAYLVSSPTIRAGDYYGGNYVEISEDGIKGYGSEVNTFKLDSSDGSVTIRSSGGGDYIEIDGTDNSLKFWESGNSFPTVEIDTSIYSTIGGIVIRQGGVLYFYSDAGDGLGIYYDDSRVLVQYSGSSVISDGAWQWDCFYTDDSITSRVGGRFRFQDTASSLTETSARIALKVESETTQATNAHDTIGLLVESAAAGTSADTWAIMIETDGTHLRLRRATEPSTYYTDLEVDASSDFWIKPNGGDVYIQDNAPNLHIRDTDAAGNLGIFLYENTTTEVAAFEWTNPTSELTISTSGTLLFKVNGNLKYSVSNTGGTTFADGENIYLYDTNYLSFINANDDWLIGRNVVTGFSSEICTGNAIQVQVFTSAGDGFQIHDGTNLWFEVENTGDVNFFGALYQDSVAMIDSDGYQTGTRFRTRQTLLFGNNTAMTESDLGQTVTVDATTVDGVRNGQGYRMLRAGKVTGISIQFDLTASPADHASDESHLRAYVQKNGANQSMYAEHADIDGVATGDKGAYTTANSFTFAAGDTINVELQLYHGALDLETLTVDEIAIVVEFEA